MLGFNLSSTTPYCMCIECCVFVHLMMSSWGLKYNTWSKSTYLVAFTSFFAISTLKKKFLPHSCYAHSAFQCIQIAKMFLQSPYFKLILYCSYTFITCPLSALFIHLTSVHQIISYIYSLSCATFKYKLSFIFEICFIVLNDINKFLVKMGILAFQSLCIVQKKDNLAYSYSYLCDTYISVNSSNTTATMSLGISPSLLVISREKQFEYWNIYRVVSNDDPWVKIEKDPIFKLGLYT